MREHADVSLVGGRRGMKIDTGTQGQGLRVVHVMFGLHSQLVLSQLM
jgi:hypothetical protein